MRIIFAAAMFFKEKLFYQLSWSGHGKKSFSRVFVFVGTFGGEIHVKTK